MTRLKQLREDTDTKQADLAQAVGVSASAIGNYENGIRDMSTDMVCRFCDYFDVTADYFLGRSKVATAAVTDEQAALLAAYAAAPGNVRDGIDALLAAYVDRKKTATKAVS